MTAEIQRDWPITPEEYLAAEAAAEAKHEYEDGRVYAMAGGTVQHNRIAMNITGALGRQLEGKPCEVFGSDMLVRIPTLTGFDFFYPDGMVVCNSTAPDALFQDEPTVLVEVTSPSTVRLDHGQKKRAYCTLASLRVYVIADSRRLGVMVWRRAGSEWVTESLGDRNEVVALPEIGCVLELSRIYSRVEF